MNQTSIISRVFCLTLLIGMGHSAIAAPLGTGFSYQGRLTDAGLAANGNYDLSLSLFDAPTAGIQVGSTITNLNVLASNGLFTTTLDFGTNIFTGNATWLAIGVRTNGSVAAFSPLTPRQPVSPTPYALYAAAAPVADSSVTSSKILDGTIANTDLANNAINSAKIADASIINADLAADAVTSAKILDGSMVGADLANNTVGSAQLADFIDLGRTNSDGQLHIYRSAASTPSISLFNGQYLAKGANGLDTVLLSSGAASSLSGGLLRLATTNTSNFLRVELEAQQSGGKFTLYQADGGVGIVMDGDNLGAGFIGVNGTDGTNRALLNGADFSGGGGSLRLYATNLNENVSLTTEPQGRLALRQADGSFGAILTASDANLGGSLNLNASNGLASIFLLGASGTVKLGSSAQYFAPGGEENLRLLRGNIASAGTIQTGSGFTSTRVATGHYRITYNTDFPTAPSVTATAVDATNPQIATVSQSLTTQFEVKIWTIAGAAVNSDFQFTVIGRR